VVHPASRPALVATDLDGTLLRSDGTVSSRTRAVLDDVERRGVLVVFVTGRPLRWMEALWAHVGAHGLAICSNGGVVYDVAAHAVRQARPVARAVALEVVQRLRDGVPGATFALERTTGFAQEPTFRERDPVPPGAVVGPLPEILDDATVKILVRHEAMDPEEFWAATEAVVGDLVTTTWSSVGALVEISAAGVTKATTLALLCEEHGIEPADVVAFGDMPNDLPMLEWAGTSYAMAGAHHSVVAAADHVAPGNDEDGVAHVLEALFELEAGPPPDRAGTRR
jgi:Cof subfamily protein (haloacid dehalogenase superfamily)